MTNENLIMLLEAMLGAFANSNEPEYREFWDTCIAEHSEDGTTLEEFQDRIKREVRAEIARARGVTITSSASAASP